jgi:tetratricopeptide (TPR) repeat protein
MKNYVEASEWFIRYIQLEKNKKSPELYAASMSLGKCQRQLNRLPQSIEAFKFAMARELTPEQQTKVAIELARTEIAAQSYVKALSALHKLPVTPNLTEDEIDTLLLTAQINCEIGMPEKAAIALQNAIDRAFSKERASCLAVPLAGALVQMGEGAKASDVLNKILSSIPPSATANEIQCQLAAVDLELGRNPEAITLCTTLIAVKPSDELIDKAFRIMGRAYANMKQYDKAALAYAGRVSVGGGAGI